MAAAGDGRTATEGGGAGGKFRKKPFRRNQTTTTPYDRPITALRNPSWLTKLVVDPATKLITSSAQRFLSSFRKRLPPPPTPLPPPEGGQNSKDLLQESCHNDNAEAVVAAGHEVRNAACSSSGGSAFSELEQILDQKTFSRAEVDRLIELLSSKTVDTPAGNDNKAEAVQYRPLPNFPSSLMEKNRSDSVTSDAAAATPVTSRAPKDNAASPAELAKAYMGRRPSNVSPPYSSSQNQVVRVDTPLPKNVAYSQNLPFVTSKAADLVGVRANRLTTPRSRGRSAIYNMARIPYSRIRQTDAHVVHYQASSSTYNAYGGPSSSHPVLEHNGYFGSGLPLKRRSSVLEDDLGSIGPMRRTRQKPNLLSHGVSRSSTREVSKEVGDNGDTTATHTRYVHVSPRSGETAAKILEHLDSSIPKGKSSESKPAAGEEKTHKKLTPNMFHGLKSLESLDSSKLLLQSTQDSPKLEGRSKVVPTVVDGSSYQKQGKIEQNGQKTFINEATVKVQSDAKFSFEDAQPGVGAADSLDRKPTAQPLKHAFRMSAPEVSFELDEDIDYDAPQLAEGRDKVGTSGAEKKSLSTDEALNRPAAFLETKATPGILEKRNDMDAPYVAVTNLSSTSILPSAGPTSPKVILPSVVSNKSQDSNVDKAPALFSSSPQPTGLRPESSSRQSDPARSLSQLFESDNSEKDGKSNGKLEALSSPPSSICSFSNGQFAPSASFADPSCTSSLSNGKYAPSAISATSALASSNFLKAGNSVTLNSGLFGSSATSSVTPTVSAPGADTSYPKTEATDNGNLNSSAPSLYASSSPGNGIFGFSSSGMLTGTMASSVSGAQNSLAVSESASTVSQSIPCHFGSSSSTEAGKKSGMTFFSSAGSSDGNLVGSSTAASVNFSFGANSSTSSSVGPSSGMTQLAFTFGATPPVSTAVTTALATSSKSTPAIFGLGVNFSSSLESSTPTTPPSPSIFNFGASSSASSLNSISTSTATAPPIFGFGGSSSASSTNAVNASSTVSTHPFAFGATSVSSQTSTSTPGIFSFGGSSSASTTNTVNASSTASPSSFAFGATSASSQTSSTVGIFGFSSSVSSTTPSGFTFGASSSSFSAPNTTAVVFGSTPSSGPSFTFGATSSAASSTSSGPAFSFGATASTNSSPRPIFGNPITFTASPGNSDQMNMEDSMAEDAKNSPSPAVPFGQPSPGSFVFGQPSVAPSPGGPMFGQPTVSPSPGGSVFGSTAAPFQFGGQPSQAPAQNPSPFAASSSLEFGGGGSFSLGSSGPDKSSRKYVKVQRNKNRRK